MISETDLPEWLDSVIMELNASYDRKCDKARDNLTADEKKVREYLGTYFPRSYGEVYCIAGNLFQNSRYRPLLANEHIKEISILDIGCGTGGEIIGLLSVLNQTLASDVNITVWAFDGNSTSLGYMYDVVSAFNNKFRTPLNAITVRPYYCPVKSEANFLSLVKAIGYAKFDYILCCKMGNELIDKGYISNPYLSVAMNFSAALKPNGIMLILDLTDRLSEQRPYFPTKMNFELNSFFLSYDQNGNQFGDQFGTLVPKPCGELPQCHRACYMQKEFTISSPEYPLFSRYPGDSSKVCYRIICRKELRDTIIQKSDRVLEKTQIINHNGIYNPACSRSKGDDQVDAFDLNA